MKVRARIGPNDVSFLRDSKKLFEHYKKLSVCIIIFLGTVATDKIEGTGSRKILCRVSCYHSTTKGKMTKTVTMATTMRYRRPTNAQKEH
jgi:hypothetical protein